MKTIGLDKEQFLKQFGDDYGYPDAAKNVDEIRDAEFKRLNGLVYLDHAGATLYSELQMEAIFKDLTTSVYGNPHSLSDANSTTSDIVREARQEVLDFFNASPTEYKCIFTSGATAAFKLVGEAFPWSNQSTFMYTMENHNSVLGIREYALDKGASALAIDLEEVEHDGGGCRSKESQIKIVEHPVQRRNIEGFPKEEPTGCGYNLFAFPSECNFSGSRFHPNLVNIMKDGSERVLEGSTYCKRPWMVLVDAAKGCTTEPLDLSQYRADFVVVSFYKIFGYPSGLGALVVRTEAAKLLKKKYFSGGTVAASIADVDFVKRRDGVEESFEDGTISFLSISSVLHGFKILKTLTMPAISRHTSTLATYVRTTLLSMTHQNGYQVCSLYGNFKSKVLYDEMGPIVSFNLKRPDCSWFGYREVEKLASLSGIQLRTGCFCNPGACAKYLGLSHSDLLSNIEAGHICWDDQDILNGKPTGAVRVSFGYMSTFEDAQRFINFIWSSFVSEPIQPGNKFNEEARLNIFPNKVSDLNSISSRYYLRAIAIYPIKSCGGFRADCWPLCSTGLLHDREWLLKSLSGEILTQKKVPEMSFISTSIDLSLGILLVESPRCKARLEIKLEPDTSTTKHDLDLYAQRYEVQDYDNDINIWFSTAVGRPCILLRCSSSNNFVCRNGSKREGMCRDVDTRLNFVNEAQLLLISEESVSNLNNRLCSNMQEGISEPPIQVNAMRFRPNIVISGGEPYAEDEWRSVKIGNKCFVSLGGCNRCQMINLNPQEGKLQRSREPLATLASFRRVKGKIFFGVLLRLDNSNEIADNPWIQVGEEVVPDTEQP